jgi:hypothetical protein
VAIWAEFGDVRRFANSRQAVRFWPGHHHHRVGRQTRPRPSGPPGSPVLGWALHQAAMGAARPSSPTTPPTSRSTSAWVAAGRAVGGPQAGPRGLPHLRELGDQALVGAELPTAA